MKGHLQASRVLEIVPLTLVFAFAAATASAHEAWLLTPAEIEALVAEPMPALFASHLWLGVAAVIGAALTMIALIAEDRLRPHEQRIAAPLLAGATAVGPMLLRFGMAIMLVLAGTGGLPRHGTALWVEPTLLVPDMQLGLVFGWDWLAAAQIILALALAVGLLARPAGALLIGLSFLGMMLFGAPFLAYAPHFAAPGLILMLSGGGAMSLDRRLGLDDVLLPSPAALKVGWRLSQILVGAGFLYLAIAFKLTQPTLLIAILDHGNLPTFGMPQPVVALIMTGIEIICGALLIVGRLTRPVALAIIAAITTLAVGLGETPLFHANLYGIMVFLLMAGPALPDARVSFAGYRRAAT